MRSRKGGGRKERCTVVLLLQYFYNSSYSQTPLCVYPTKQSAGTGWARMYSTLRGRAVPFSEHTGDSHNTLIVLALFIVVALHSVEACFRARSPTTVYKYYHTYQVHHFRGYIWRGQIIFSTTATTRKTEMNLRKRRNSRHTVLRLGWAQACEGGSDHRTPPTAEKKCRRMVVAFLHGGGSGKQLK